MATTRTDIALPDEGNQSYPQWLASLRRVVGRTGSGAAVVMASFPRDELQGPLIEKRRKSLMAMLSDGADDIERKAKAIGMLLAGYPATAKGGETGDAMMVAYLSLIRDEPAWAVEDACNGISRGRFATIDRRFCPTAPQVADCVQMMTSQLRYEMEDLNALLQVIHVNG